MGTQRHPERQANGGGTPGSRRRLRRITPGRIPAGRPARSPRSAGWCPQRHRLGLQWKVDASDARQGHGRTEGAEAMRTSTPATDRDRRGDGAGRPPSLAAQTPGLGTAQEARTLRDAAAFYGGPDERRSCHILVPLDGSPLAEEVLPFAARLATALAVPLTLLRIIPNLSAVVASGSDAAYAGHSPPCLATERSVLSCLGRRGRFPGIRGHQGRRESRVRTALSSLFRPAILADPLEATKYCSAASGHLLGHGTARSGPPRPGRSNAPVLALN
jgi:hypothetical protein